MRWFVDDLKDAYAYIYAAGGVCRRHLKQSENRKDLSLSLVFKAPILREIGKN